MIFGSWIVTSDAVMWNNDGMNRFVIPLEQLNRTRTGMPGTSVLYDWILLATEEDWLTQNDLYDLNFAFVFAIAKTGANFDYDIFDATLAVQFEQFEMEDDEEVE